MPLCLLQLLFRPLSPSPQWGLLVPPGLWSLQTLEHLMRLQPRWPLEYLTRLESLKRRELHSARLVLLVPQGQCRQWQ